MLLSGALSKLVRIGRLTVIDAGGHGHTFKGTRGPHATVRLHNRAVEARILANPELGVGEAYMNGSLTIEEGSLLDFLMIGALNNNRMQRGGLWALRDVMERATRALQQANPVGRSRRNVAHHYDLSDDLYQLFLDPDRQYSCAYFLSSRDDLAKAQWQKKLHIAAKLALEPGMEVLDIGSGWGGMALYLASNFDVRVTGLTLSRSQFDVATKRAAASGLADRVRFKLLDYRQEFGAYDRIVSVGMFEHVGAPHHRIFFDKVNSLLADDGVALIHAIGRRDQPGSTNAWLRKYIFPGGYAPALSEVMSAVEASGLWSTDIEILRLHYAETLRHWRERFMARWREAADLYDERFCRMWEFYLTGSEAAFRAGGMMVFQLQLARAVNSLPITRDYMGLTEQIHFDVQAAMTAGRVAATEIHEPEVIRLGLA